MAYDVRFTGPARRDLRETPSKVVAAVVEFAYGDLAREPRRVGKPLGRELAELFGAWRGPYRVLYRIDDDAGVIHVVRIKHRADVYRTGSS